MMKRTFSHFNETEFDTILEKNAIYFEKHLLKFINSKDFGILKKAIKYAICGHGKRLRPLLCIESAKVFDIPKETSIFTAIAIECIHTYSLIHDDLPSMDNDDLRRGKPTIHKKWNEATAVLVGDALQSLGFEVLSSDLFNVSSKTKIKLLNRLAQKSGASGMVLGQALDMEAESRSTRLTIEDISLLQEYKTGKLISWSCEVGPIIAEKDPQPLSEYASKIGLAFQIIDDVLDVVSSTKSLGKRAGKDFEKNKATFVSQMGLDNSKKRASELINEACECISVYGQKSKVLNQVAQFIMYRST